jgi:hypothetical protein
MNKRNTIQATVNTLIPRSSITDLEILMLKAHGFECKKDADHCYFFATNSILDHVDKYKNVKLVDAKNALKQDENLAYFNENFEIVNSNYLAIFQNILKRDMRLSEIEIQGACIGSEMRLGEYGGFAELITRDGIMSMGTGQFISEAQMKIKAQAPSSKNNVSKIDFTDKADEHEDTHFSGLTVINGFRN